MTDLASEPAKTGRVQGRFKPGQSGNPRGKPRGSRNKTTLAVQALLDGEAEGLTRKAIELALAGDVQCLRLCLDRISPAPRARAVAINLPEVGRYDAADALLASYGAVTKAIATGEITPSEAVEIITTLDAHRTAITDLQPDAMRREPTPEERAEQERLNKQMADLLKPFTR
jgi:hypothetical protein